MQGEIPKGQTTRDRILIILGLILTGLLVLSFLIGSLPRAEAGYTVETVQSAWTAVFTETFESGISAGWTVTDVNGNVNGEYYWATTVYTASEAANSAWASGGGANGIGLTPGVDDYPNDSLSSMIHSAVNLSGTTDAQLTFDYWLDSEPGLDVLQVRVSTDGVNFTAETSLSGNSNGWQNAVVDLSSYISETQVWIEFLFSSNSAVTGKGVFIDNVVLETKTLQYVYLPIIKLDPTPTPTPTPTPVPYFYFDEFDNSASGWPVVDNTWNPQDCFKWYYASGNYWVDICDDRTDVKASPLVELPTGDYTIEVDARFTALPGWWSAYGILFDAKDDPDPNNPDLGDYNMLWILWEGSTQIPKIKWKLLRDIPGDQQDITNWQDMPDSKFDYSNGGLAWNTWKIVRTDSTISVYVNDNFLVSVNEARPTTNNQILFGVYGSTYELSDLNAAFDNYLVTENNGSVVWRSGDSQPYPYYVSGDFSLEALLPPNDNE